MLYNVIINLYNITDRNITSDFSRLCAMNPAKKRWLARWRLPGMDENKKQKICGWRLRKRIKIQKIAEIEHGKQEIRLNK